MGIVFKRVKLYQASEHLVDVFISEGRIEKIAATTLSSNDGYEIIEGNERTLLPGLVDVHVHLREPGGEKKETIETGSNAAARGGFTTICAMPNTRPVPDSLDALEGILGRMQEKGVVRVLPYAAITRNQAGKELVDVEGLAKMGAFAFTDDGVGVQSAGQMLKAMKAASAAGKAIVAHCEDNTLLNGGSFHDGKKAAELGLSGISSISEAVHIARDVLLAEAANCHYHVCHISTKESVRVVRDAKKAGIRVTAEVTPHHLLLCEDDIPGVDPQYKMNPPLRAKADQDALWEGLLDGTIDIIATDHAPHTEEEKANDLHHAPFGIVGLETAFPLLYTHLVKTGKASLAQLVHWLSTKPAELFQLDAGTINVGAVADLTLVDVEKVTDIDTTAFASKGKNTPFQDWTCQGWPVATMVNGQIVWREDDQR
ncbi:dihydroorotase [Aureibacillus halotolerans]|uniref:Dihydroorotase n=1 Tax=Aureibacillus halotolerans TaxID=1508390 RepID=A0A4R6U7L5_9BACI|nr:dihydroorotase [Aureibacillus halotolerans]TDQ42351.1 dihydroorotase [Aureibacillus halotolerans]